jgi:hypothetical protein
MKRILSILFAVALVLAFSLVATTPVAAATLTVNTGLPNVPPNYWTIQAAVTAASPGDTIMVAAGTYTEQINITKSLTLSGAGMASTHIVSPTPASMTIYDQFGSKSPTPRYIVHRGANIPVVRIAASNVVFQGFHVDLGNQVFWDVKGSYPADTTYSRGVGILVDHVETTPGTPDVFTGIAIQNNKVDGLKSGDLGDGIKVLGSATATVTSNTVYGGESGLNFQAVDAPVRGLYYPTVTANSNTIYSSGPSFGIGFWSCATGSADSNTIYNDPVNNGAALNVWGSRPVSFTNNIVTNVGAVIGGWGAQLYESTNLIFTNNRIEYQSLAGAIWTGGPNPPTVTMTGNTIDNCVDGFVIDHQTSGAVTMHFNSFEGIASGHYAVKVGGPAGGDSGTAWGTWEGPSTVTVDALYNWWGANDGPGGVGTASFTPSAGTLTGLSAVAEGSLPAAARATKPINFPDGLFSFTITGLSNGQTVTVTITLPSPVPVGTQYWKYHVPEGWINVSSLLGDNDGDNVLTLTLTDGGLGDDDGTANGLIDDQGGEGTGAVGWETYPINKVRVFLPWIALLAAIMAGVSLFVLRRRRAQS